MAHQHILGDAGQCATVTLVDVLVPSLSSASSSHPLRLPATMAYYKRARHVSTPLDLVEQELVALPPFLLEIRMDRPLPLTLLRRRLWDKYSWSDFGSGLTARLEKAGAALFGSFAAEWEQRSKARWKAKNAKEGKVWGSRHDREDEKEDDRGLQALLEAAERDEADARATRKEPEEKKEATTTTTIPIEAEEETLDEQVDIPDNFLDVEQRVVSGIKDTSAYYILTIPSLHVTEFLLSWISYNGRSKGFGKQLNKKEKAEGVLPAPPLNGATLIFRHGGPIMSGAVQSKLPREWPRSVPLHAYWQEQVPIWSTKMHWRCSALRSLEKSPFPLVAFKLDHARVLQDMRLEKHESTIKKGLSNTRIGSRSVMAWLKHLKDVEGMLGSAIAEDKVVLPRKDCTIMISTWVRTATALRGVNPMLARPLVSLLPPPMPKPTPPPQPAAAPARKGTITDFFAKKAPLQTDT